MSCNCQVTGFLHFTLKLQCFIVLKYHPFTVKFTFALQTAYNCQIIRRTPFFDTFYELWLLFVPVFTALLKIMDPILYIAQASHLRCAQIAAFIKRDEMTEKDSGQ